MTNPIIIDILPSMNSHEGYRESYQEIFSIEGQIIGGPENYWKPIPHEEKPVKNAWEFINERNPNGALQDYKFKFPKKTFADVYIEIEGATRWFTIMGGEEAALNTDWQVSKIQLYFDSPEWNQDYQNMWSLWENKGDRMEQSQWFNIGFIPKDSVEKEYKIKKSVLRKGGIAALVLAGATVLANIGHSSNPQTSYTPPSTPIQQEQVALMPIETPAQIATVTPIPEIQTPVLLPYNSKPIQAGETISASKGGVISGDVWINGQKYSDDIANSGELIILDQDAQITAPNGATLFYDVNMDVYQLAQQEKQKMLQKGCGLPNGCSYVDIISFPEQAPQGQ